MFCECDIVGVTRSVLLPLWGGVGCGMAHNIMFWLTLDTHTVRRCGSLLAVLVHPCLLGWVWLNSGVHNLRLVCQRCRDRGNTLSRDLRRSDGNCAEVNVRMTYTCLGDDTCFWKRVGSWLLPFRQTLHKVCLPQPEALHVDQAPAVELEGLVFDLSAAWRHREV